jgi:hypothetical protein
MKDFAYNTGSPIYGTDQIGDLAVGTANGDYNYTNNPQFWGGADDTTGYIIAAPVPANDQPTFVTDYIYLDPSYKGTGITLTNGNQSASQISDENYVSVLGTRIIESTDRVMFSVLFDQSNIISSDPFIGIGTRSMSYNGEPTSSYPGVDNQSMGYRGSEGTIWYNNTTYATGLPTFGDNDIIDIVIDNNVSGMWVRVNGGDWNNNPSDNPETNSGGIEIINAPFYPVLCPGGGGRLSIQNTSAYGTPNNFEFLGQETASVCFFGTGNTESEFIFLANRISGQDFESGGDASTWLTTNGYWNNWSNFGSSGFQWMTMTSITNSTAAGIGQNSVTVAITQSNGGMEIESSGMYEATTFPEEYGVPLDGIQIRNTSDGVFTATFSQPVTDALVAFASVGNPGLQVPVQVSAPFTPIWGQATTYQNASGPTQYTQFTGQEGFNIIRIDGTVTTVSFTYTVSEFYCTICFGFVDQNA